MGFGRDGAWAHARCMGDRPRQAATVLCVECEAILYIINSKAKSRDDLECVTFFAFHGSRRVTCPFSLPRFARNAIIAIR